MVRSVPVPRGRATSSEVFAGGPNASPQRGGCAPVRLSRSASCGGRRVLGEAPLECLDAPRPLPLSRRPASRCARISVSYREARTRAVIRVAVDTRRGNSFSRTSANAISSWSLKPGLGTHVKSASVRPDAMRVPRVQFETFEQRQDGCPEDLEDDRARGESSLPRYRVRRGRAPTHAARLSFVSASRPHMLPTATASVPGVRRHPHPDMPAEGSPCSKRWTYSSAGMMLALGAMHVLDHHRGLERPCCERPKTGLMREPFRGHEASAQGRASLATRGLTSSRCCTSRRRSRPSASRRPSEISPLLPGPSLPGLPGGSAGVARRPRAAAKPSSARRAPGCRRLARHRRRRRRGIAGASFQLVTPQSPQARSRAAARPRTRSGYSSFRLDANGTRERVRAAFQRVVDRTPRGGVAGRWLRRSRPSRLYACSEMSEAKALLQAGGSVRCGGSGAIGFAQRLRSWLMRLPRSPGHSPGERRVGRIAELLQAHILRHTCGSAGRRSSFGQEDPLELLHDVLIDNGLKSVERLLVRLQEAAALDGFGVVELEEEVVRGLVEL